MPISKLKINYTWILAGFCFYTIFHQLPVFLLNLGSLGLFDVFDFIILLLFVGFISLYLGYKAKHYVSLELGIASFIYLAIQLILKRNTIFQNAKEVYWDHGKEIEVSSNNHFYVYLIFFFLIFFCSYYSSYIGRKLKLKNSL